MLSLYLSYSFTEINEMTCLVFGKMLKRTDVHVAFVLVFFTMINGHILRKDGSGVYLLTEDEMAIAVKELDSVLVAFYSPKCRSCRTAETELSKVAKILSTSATKDHQDIFVGKIDVSKEKSVMDRYQLKKLPTLIFFVAGGAVPYPQGRLLN